MPNADDGGTGQGATAPPFPGSRDSPLDPYLLRRSGYC